MKILKLIIAIVALSMAFLVLIWRFAPTKMIEEFAKKAEEVIVICLYKGEVNLPKNVTVYSLGKEKGVSHFGYVINLYHYLFLIRGSYDRVFIHMNQEYILLAGLYWKIKKIPVYMWRNHPVGNILTHLAVWLSTKTFCTSTSSFVARFNNKKFNNLNKANNDSQQAAAVANAETTYKWVNNGSVSKSDSRKTGDCSSKKQVTTYTCDSSTKGNKLYDGTNKGTAYGDTTGHAWPIYEGENTSTATEYTYDGDKCSLSAHNADGTVNEWECKSSDSSTTSSS